MAPSIALEAIGTFDSGQRVLDPMSGSGTVLAVARSQGHRAFGIDCDPLAVLNSKVWTTAIDPEVVQHKAKDVLSRANLLFEETAIRDAYPSNADDETRRFIRFWFDQRSRRQLAALATCIRRIHSQSTRDVLWIGFSRMIDGERATERFAAVFGCEGTDTEVKKDVKRKKDRINKAIGRKLGGNDE